MIWLTVSQMICDIIDISYFLSGIKLTLSTLLDGKNINAGGHKMGLGLEFEA